MEEKVLFGCSSIDAFRIQEKLGEGTFGQVHRAQHTATGTSVALKEILLHQKDDGMPITALREIKILKSLDHENVIELLDMAVKRGSRPARQRSTFYMVTPYMDHDLAGLLQNSKVRLTVPHIKCYLGQLLEGMDYLHQQKYMHRDIKAANILLDNRGRVKLADFGLARKYHEPPPSIEGVSPANTKYTATVVTRWYRPPELLLGDQFYTPAIDMWGIGCVFGEIFHRKPIFPGKSDPDQVVTIFQMLGSPTQESMPGYTDLPGASLVPPAKYDRRLDSAFANIPVTARSLLAGLLDLNPLKRLTARGALEHEFFTTGPPAAAQNELPIYTSSHEMNARKNQQQQQQQQRQEPQKPHGLPHKPEQWDNRQPAWARGDGRRQSYGNRRRALGFKVPNRPILHGIDLIPPYRRAEYKKRPAHPVEPDPKRFRAESLDY